MPMPAPSELAEHSTSVGHNFRHCKPKPSEHPGPGGAPRGVVRFSDNQPVSEPAGQSKTCDDLVPKPAPSEFTEQPGGEGLLSEADTVSRPLPAGLPGVFPEPQQSKDSPRMGRQDVTGPRPESDDWFSSALVSHRMGPRGRN